MSKLYNKRILIFQQRAWGRRIGRFLAKKFYDEGCSLAAVTSTKKTHDCIVGQEDIKYEMIICHDEVIGQPEKFLAGDDYSLEEICKDLGIDSIWPLVSGVRMMVRSYKDKYYYGFKQCVSDEEIVKYVKATYKCVKLIFDKFNPDIIVATNFVGFYHIMFCLYGRKVGTKMIGVTDSKIKGVNFFSHNYNTNRGSFIERVDELNSGENTKNREKAKQYITEFRKTFKKPSYSESEEQNKKSFIKIIKGELSPYAHIVRWYRDKYVRKVKNELPNVEFWTGYRSPRIILRDHYCQKKYLKFANNYKYYNLKNIKKYVYFPLQVQPEETIDVFSPYFSNQIETARLIAMSLPDDYTLVVKNHPVMADYTPPSYLEKVARTINIKLIDYRIPSEEVLKGADLIISPGGTSLAEAAFYNKPAIQLGNLGTNLKLPNVVKHTDMTTLSARIKERLKENLRTEDYERKLENFVAAAYDVGFDLDYLGAYYGGRSDLLDSVWEVYKKEVEKNIRK